ECATSAARAAAGFPLRRGETRRRGIRCRCRGFVSVSQSSLPSFLSHGPEPLARKLQVRFGSLARLLLEGVQDIYRLRKPGNVDQAVSVSRAHTYLVDPKPDRRPRLPVRGFLALLDFPLFKANFCSC